MNGRVQLALAYPFLPVDLRLELRTTKPQTDLIVASNKLAPSRSRLLSNDVLDRRHIGCDVTQSLQ